MVTLYCDLGDTRDVACGLVEPLQFEDGFAEVDDEVQAAQIVARHTHIHHARNHLDADIEADEDDEDDAEDEVVESDTCDEIMSNGEICGRELPCGYHS